MSEPSPAKQGPVALVESKVNVTTNTMTTSQLQRAWCLGYVRTIWPTIDPVTALNLAGWLMSGATS